MNFRNSFMLKRTSKQVGTPITIKNDNFRTNCRLSRLLNVNSVFTVKLKLTAVTHEVGRILEDSLVVPYQE